MKFIAFDVRDDEKTYFLAWERENNIKVTLDSGVLDDQALEKVKGYDGVLALQTRAYPAGMFEFFKKHGIKVLSVRNVGVDNLDLKAAQANQILVTNVPAYSPNAIAEFSVTQLLQLLRQTTIFRQKVAAHDFRWAPYIGEELCSKTVGVIGTGRIGKAAIKIYQGFNAQVIAYDLYPDPKLKSQGIYVPTLADLFQQADVITLHLPATAQDHYLLGEKAFAQMKQGVYIVNTARGALIDTKALLAALKNHRVAGAALDTYENENSIFNHDLRSQPFDDPILAELLVQPNVLITPHIAFYTKPAVENMVLIALNSAKAVCQQGKSDNLVTK
ncbi:D-2-hydroxyacid dehydrogenase [Liquorilactobacillus sicerae]|uniref:D-2-hydroxyacid dehydrogenase n=1 Tax=Liquorilactobacillus sicerae TaxID=1416943 RepID=UPI002480D14F|nr:D-2-hydroxyacid dehydrogenase [Liquorilactobacillus sicerae]